VDEFDLAQRHEQIFREDAIRKALTTQPEEPLIIDGHRHCLHCEKRIPRKRLKVKPDAMRCVGCQEILERRSRQSV